MSQQKSKALVIAGHVVAVLLAAAFIMSGLTKLSGNEGMVQNFARWGFPGFFIYVVGLTEVVAAVLLVIPKTRAFGASALVGTMVGAAGTHAMFGEWAHIAPSIVLGTLSAITLWTNRESILKFLPGTNLKTPQTQP